MPTRGRKHELLAVHAERRSEGRDDLAGHGRRVLGGAKVHEDDAELLVPEPAHRVALAHARRQAPPHELLEPLGERRREGVLGGAHAQDVHAQRRHQVAVPVGAGQGLVEAVEEKRPVGQVGDGIVGGEVAKPRGLVEAFDLHGGPGSEDADEAVERVDRRPGSRAP